MSLAGVIGFDGRIHVADIGAAAIAELPPYKALLDRGIARLSAVDGDERQAGAIRQAFGADTAVFSDVIADGRKHILHLASPQSGMSSILKPSKRGLAFFNLFTRFGQVERKARVATKRLADIEPLQGIDYLKMDIQGAELMVLENAGSALDRCVAIQLEASFVPLYEDQPSFGDIDLWMRRHGFLPHCFTEVKRWSIAPTVRNNDPRFPWNQLLECDVVYVRQLVSLKGLSNDQVRKIALIAAYCYHSPDLCLHAVGELERRGSLPPGQSARVVAILNSGA